MFKWCCDPPHPQNQAVPLYQNTNHRHSRTRTREPNSKPPANFPASQTTTTNTIARTILNRIARSFTCVCVCVHICMCVFVFCSRARVMESLYGLTFRTLISAARMKFGIRISCKCTYYIHAASQRNKRTYTTYIFTRRNEK